MAERKQAQRQPHVAGIRKKKRVQVRPDIQTKQTEQHKTRGADYREHAQYRYPHFTQRVSLDMGFCQTGYYQKRRTDIQDKTRDESRIERLSESRPGVPDRCADHDRRYN